MKYLAMVVQLKQHQEGDHATQSQLTLAILNCLSLQDIDIEVVETACS